jgi:hypothetical protein
MSQSNRSRWTQYRCAALGWCNYPWGDGLRGAKATFRHVRVVSKYQGESGLFEIDKTRVLRLYKDGTRST